MTTKNKRRKYESQLFSQTTRIIKTVSLPSEDEIKGITYASPSSDLIRGIIYIRYIIVVIYIYWHIIA